MSAPRTSAAIADDLAEWRKGVSSQPLKAVMMEAIAALRPALPAEVEAVVAKLARAYCPDWHEAERPEYCPACCAIVVLRRYVQAVAEKDGAKCPCDVHACLATVAEKDAELQAVEALCAEPLPGGNPAIVALARLKNIRKILREEH